ncbi:MAG: B12-binding domain-containing radical SAM protein [Clostridium sp.]|nr:B12-binding domain-containing radical SAM protein [Acetatifactor muris]MCM1525763.1 B12-binding domain-containing radical SAM protein [Bacteroides sp.]MCM1564083.1 B12-binding domain-containing radical SAM protein [Clostridium sp.]
MQFLLVAINAKYIHSNPAVYSLRAYAGEEMRSRVSLAEYTINQQMQDILADICERKPSVIGFSCYIWNWNMVRDLIRELPKILPETDIWLGGPEVSFDAPKTLAEFPQLRGVMVGEGEATFRELLHWYADGEGILEEIAGLCLPGGYTPKRELMDLNSLPFFYAAGIGQADSADTFANRIIYYESSRGCPYGCSYCLSSIDKTVRFRNRETVERELQFFLDRQVRQVKFVDRTFNCDREHTMGIWRYLHKHDNGVTNFHFEIAADLLREEEIALLQSLRPGQVQLEIGVQSTNPETLRAIHRVADVNRLESVVAAIHKAHNVHIHLDLIVGLPYEDYASFARSFNRVYGMRPEQLQMGFLKVLKGSPMAGDAAGYGIVCLDKPPYEVLSTKWLTCEEVFRLKRVEEMVEVYYNSNQFARTLSFLERRFDGPFALFEALADHYKSRGYLVQNPARVYRYQVLLEFAMEHDAANVEIYRELLTYDLYLRENAKSRPSYATDLRERPEVKQYIRDFYQREEKERKFLPAYAEYDWKQLSRMTHLEPFRYPVWRSPVPELLEGCNGEKYGEDRAAAAPYYALFDYGRRDPLDGGAAVRILESGYCPDGGMYDGRLYQH